MTNRIDQLTGWVAENPLPDRITNPLRSTVNPVALQLTSAVADSQAQIVAPDTPSSSVPLLSIEDPQSRVTEAELDTALELFQQQLLTDVIAPLTSRISELEQQVLLLEQRITALE